MTAPICFPFGAFCDFRPTVQAASAAFEGRRCLPPGPWDALGTWLGQRGIFQAEYWKKAHAPELFILISGGAVLRSDGCWAMLRAAHYFHRPGRSDQLHVDVWWRGQNIALDAGSYRYNAPPPWDNGLAGGQVHNSVSIEGAEAMTRAGRFLWLDWDQATLAPARRRRWSPSAADIPGWGSATGVCWNWRHRTYGELRTNCWQ